MPCPNKHGRQRACQQSYYENTRTQLTNTAPYHASLSLPFELVLVGLITDGALDEVGLRNETESLRKQENPDTRATHSTQAL